MGLFARSAVVIVAAGACAATPAIALRPTKVVTPGLARPAERAQLAPEPPPPVVSDATRDRAAERVQRQVARAGAPPEPYLLTPRITRLDVSVGSATTVACTIEVRVSSAGARGDERWEVGRTATAIGRALVTSSASPGEVESSVDACVDSAANEAVQRRVAPFLERSVAAR